MVTSKEPFEIPQAMRDLAEQSLEQTRSAYNQLMDASRKAQQMLLESSEVAATGARDMQLKTMHYAQANLEAGFELMDKLVRAKDAREALEIQAAHARKQMDLYAEQVRELTRLLSDTARKSQPR